MPDPELQMRPTSSSSASSPATLDQKLQQGDLLREAKEQLESSLKTITTFYASPKAPAHTGPPNCERCNTRKRRITAAYHEYYLADTPGRWDSNLPEYRAELQRLFDQPNGPPLEEIHTLFQNTLRSYLKQTLLAPSSQDDKDATASMLSAAKDTSTILDTYHTSSQSCALENALLAQALSSAQSPQERARLYIETYCIPSPTDTPPQKNLKQKYARLFEQLTPHDEVMAAWRQEAERGQEAKLGEMKGRLADLRMGQSAHLKAKRKKEEAGHGEVVA
ncbi:hypothetical protein LSUE1_G010125, partial [Lachnellula suecica]